MTNINRVKRCKFCKKPDNEKNLVVTPSGSIFHRQCKKDYDNARYQIRKDDADSHPNLNYQLIPIALGILRGWIKGNPALAKKVVDKNAVPDDSETQRLIEEELKKI